MDDKRAAVDEYLLKFAVWSAMLFVVALTGLLIFNIGRVGFLSISYLISFLFVGSNFLVIRKITRKEASQFLKLFVSAIAARFVVVIGVIILFLEVANQGQIFFTISFIISYLCHSVMEIIFLRKIIETEKI